MKTQYLIVNAAVLAVLVLTPVLLALPVSAASQVPESVPPGDYLLVLPVVTPDRGEIPANLTPERAKEFAKGLTHRQAHPILSALEGLQSQEMIAGFEVRTDLHGILVTGATETALSELSRLQGVEAVFPFNGDEPPVCAAAAARELPMQVLALSHAADQEFRLLQNADATVGATNPSITIYSTRYGYSYFYGQTSANTAVSMRILRGGQVIATDTTSSYQDGSYLFTPEWSPCPNKGYNWTLRPGDVVEVTAQGRTVSTVVAYLSTWADPATNIVAGKTDAGRSVQVTVQNASGPCTVNEYEMTVTTDASGNFSADFTSQVDFNSNTIFIVYSKDANGNSTNQSKYPFGMVTQLNSSYASGYIKPNQNFTATLRRSGSIISTYNGSSGADGYYGTSFSSTIQPGDIISVDGGGVSMQYTAVSFDVTINPVTDQASGTTGAGRLVRAFFSSRAWGYVVTSCEWSETCAGVTANGSGGFTLNAGMDLQRGDEAWFYVYDAEGNHQYERRNIPAIGVEPAYRNFFGYWGKPAASSLTVTHKANGGSVKQTISGVWVDSEGGFYSTFNNAVIPTDIIEVTDGSTTESMTVQSLSARLDGGTGHITGNANGRLLARLWDYRPESGYWNYFCKLTTASGTYNLSFDGVQPGGGDQADVYNTGPDGHYTYAYRFAFTANIIKGSNFISGYSETGNTPVTVTLLRGASPVSTKITTSSSSSYFYASLDSPSVTITQGDTVQVVTGDGDSVSLLIPELTVNLDAVNNRLYGRSPANQLINVSIDRIFKYGYYVYDRPTVADGSGNYSVSFNGEYWSKDCSPVNVGHRCSRPRVYYVTTAGHTIRVEGAYPQPAGPDAFESDNAYTSAKPYAAKQTHTFHDGADVDWVSFVVPQADVDSGVLYRIETVNLGWEMDTVLRLYDTNGTSELASGDNGGVGGASLIMWAPPAAGTYFIRINPYNSNSTAYCDAFYDLIVFPIRAQVFLPLGLRY